MCQAQQHPTRESTLIFINKKHKIQSFDSIGEFEVFFIQICAVYVGDE